MIPLEDSAADVLGKAQRGLGLDEAEVARRANLPLADYQALRAGGQDAATIQRICPVLGLDAAALQALAEGKYEPVVHGPAEGFRMFTTPFEDMFVNSFLCWDQAAGTAVAFDTGANCSGLLRQAKTVGVKIEKIFLTHTHPDHIAELRRLREVTKAPIFSSAEERLNDPRTIPMSLGASTAVGRLKITPRATAGHSPGGLTYVVEGLATRLAIVGDALFAGSQGGVDAAYYESALRAIRREILSLPDETILCPGHGPLTTVRLEKAGNPFHAGRVA
ncbi:MAG: MBL fold metallo-hydrolase [Verrucomicrobia bacterium]|nr:MBL fold metallo-hydrolase [Verrucomicrobiota bacterium]